MNPFGLSADAKARLVTRFATRRTAPVVRDAAAAPPLGDQDAMADLRLVQKAGAALGIENPYFRAHAGIAGATTVIGNGEYDNFVSYNYLGLNGDARISEAAKAAIDRYGTSVSASRVVSGERPVHRELEEALAAAYGTEDALVLVSGHATNVTVIGHLVTRDDAVFHDSLSHNSIVQGALLSGARRVPFAHNDLGELDRLLSQVRPGVKRALVVVEGHYSMDGDVPDLPALVALVRRHRASLMVDEAHSLGVLGARGLGIAERCGVDPADVDVWMGTLSKTLSSCGGYICASHAMIEHLKYSAPGFVYSVGMPPPVAAASMPSSLPHPSMTPSNTTRFSRPCRMRNGPPTPTSNPSTSPACSHLPPNLQKIPTPKRISNSFPKTSRKSRKTTRLIRKQRRRPWWPSSPITTLATPPTTA